MTARMGKPRSRKAAKATAEWLEKASANHLAGRLPEAERLYRRVLAEAPEHTEALQLLGVLVYQSGRIEEAATLIGRAVALGNRVPEVLINHGLVLQRLGRGEEAEAAFLNATLSSPEAVDAHQALGRLCHRQGRLAVAETHYGRALALRPNYVDALVGMGLIAKAGGRLDEAEASFRQALALRPDHPGLLMNLGNVLNDLGRLSEAVVVFRQALAFDPGYADAHLNLGNALKSQGDDQNALAAYRRALDLKADLPEAWNNIGQIFREAGDLVRAMEAFDHALALRPDFAEAHYNRSDLKRFRPGDPDIEVLERLAGSIDRLLPGQAVFLHFALGKALDDSGDPERAFEQFFRGNSLRRRTLDYDEASTEELFERLAAMFDAPFLEGCQGAGDPSARPIFILGMPRSGSTLVEQILSSHPDVLGGGELPALERVLETVRDPGGQALAYPESISVFPTSHLAALGGAYLSRLPAAVDGRSRVTDKLPSNFLHIGLIHLILPQARIIHTVRDPVDTCLSCFTKLFAVGQKYSFDLGELGRYYRRYRALMDHWRRVLPADTILDVQYEAVVDDVEGQTRRLLAYCGLRWDERCLAFHRTQRKVRTASAAQVRAPLFTTSVNRSQAYRSQLEPLFRALEGG